MQQAQDHKSLDDWLAWFETLHPKKIDLSLNRIVAVLEALEILPAPYRVISVAGTNGKGSCVAFLESIYREAGYCVGSFTSPHLFRFNERIAVNGVWASDAELIELFEMMESARGKVTLSYFESSAVAAFLHFARRNVDLAVLEVGMGGRLDAVNAYDADAALISSIGLDHQEWLGDDRELIGREKAGIMRSGRPVIVGDPDPPDSVFREAERLSADAYYIGRDFEIERVADGISYAEGEAYAANLPAPGFGGDEQLLNVAACIKLVRSSHGDLPVTDTAMGRGIENAMPAGRLDVRDIRGVQWVFDVAHNPAAMERLAAFVSGLPAARCTWAVFGAMRDKDIPGVLSLSAGLVDSWCIAPVDSSRAAEAEYLEQELRQLGATSVARYDDVSSATVAALEAADPGDRVLVFGSFYTVGPAMAELGLYSDPTDRA